MSGSQDFYNKIQARRVTPTKHNTFKSFIKRLYPFVKHLPHRVRLLQVMSTLQVEGKLKNKGASMHRLVKLITEAYRLNEKKHKRF